MDGTLQTLGYPSPGSTKDAEDFRIHFIPGVTDEVMVYDRALSPEEIEQDSEVPVAAPQSALGNGAKLPQGGATL